MSEVVMHDGGYSISAIENHYSDMYMLFIGLRSPATNAAKAAKKAHSTIKILIDRIEHMKSDEIDDFMDSLSSLVVDDVKEEDIENFRKKIDEFGTIGKALKTFDTRFENLNSDGKRVLIEDALVATMQRMDILDRALGQDALHSTSDDVFELTVLIQSIVASAKNNTAIAIDEMKRNHDVGSDTWDMFFKGILGIIRVEALRRGKIEMDDLKDTLTEMLESNSRLNHVGKHLIEHPPWLIECN